MELSKKNNDTNIEVAGLEYSAELSNLRIIKKINSTFDRPCDRVLLINPPHFPNEMLDVRIVKNSRYYNYPPYGLGLLGQNLKSKGYKFAHLDLNFELLRFIHDEQDENIIHSRIGEIWKERINEKIEKFKPHLVGISCMFTMSHGRVIEITDYLKQLHPELILIAGGVHISNARVMLISGV